MSFGQEQGRVQWSPRPRSPLVDVAALSASSTHEVRDFLKNPISLHSFGQDSPRCGCWSVLQHRKTLLAQSRRVRQGSFLLDFPSEFGEMFVGKTRQGRVP